MANILDLRVSVKDGIVKRLKEIFPSKEVFDAPIKQGLLPDSFQVLSLPSTIHTKTFGRTRNVTYNFVVNYFPAFKEDYDTIYATSDMLAANFESIDGKYWTQGLESTISDDVLVTTFRVTIPLISEDLTTLLANMEEEVGTRP